MVEGDCKLCGHKGPLHQSHIIPRLAFKLLREKYPNGRLRDGRNPLNNRQDGEKPYMLCGNCEALFNKFETSFCNEVLHPYYKKYKTKLKYSASFHKYIVSQVWRVLVYQIYYAKSGLILPDAQKIFVLSTESKWRAYLLEKPGCTPPEVRVTILEKFVPKNAYNVSMYMKYYADVAVDGNVLNSESDVVVFAKVGRFFLMGMTGMGEAVNWGGTPVAPANGTLDTNKRPPVPVELLRYFNKQGDTIGPSTIPRVKRNKQSE